MNYNGTATIKYTIYRFDSLDNEYDIELTIYGSSSFTKGRMNCSMKDSFPDDSEVIIHCMRDSLGKEWHIDDLEDYEYRNIIDDLDDTVREKLG